MKVGRVRWEGMKKVVRIHGYHNKIMGNRQEANKRWTNDGWQTMDNKQWTMTVNCEMLEQLSSRSSPAICLFCRRPTISTFLNEHLLWFNFSEPSLHNLTSPFPQIIMVRGGHRRHIPEPVKRIFVTMSSSNVLKRCIDLVYLALVYATNKQMAELQREPSCSNVSQFAGMTDNKQWTTNNGQQIMDGK